MSHSRSSSPSSPCASTLSRPASPRRRAACLALALLAGAAVSYRVLAPKIAASSATSDAPPLALRFEPGSTLRYRAAWSGTQRGRIFEGEVAAAQPGGDTHATTSIDMALELSLFVESVNDDEARLALAITNVERHGFHLLGAEAFPTKQDAVSALIGRRARVRMATSGEARDVEFEQDAPDVFMNVVQWIVAREGISLGGSRDGAREWDADERGPFGPSKVHYARGSEGVFFRARTKYTSFDAFAGGGDARALAQPTIDGTTAIRLRDGVIEDLRGDERVKVLARAGGTELDGNLTFELQLEAIDRAAVVPSTAVYGAPSPAGQPVVGRETRAQLLAQRIDGMTPEQLLADVEAYANAGVMPQHTRWMWRASGLLKREPEIAGKLARSATARGATDKARALVLDLLASVGDAAAQAAMRDILASPVLASSAARPGLLQRVSFLDAPEDRTVAAVVDAMREGRQKGWKDLRFAAAHSVAAASRAAATNGDEGTARQLVRRLGDEVRAAETPEARTALLGALANASIPEVAAIVAPFASSEDADLREAAADAVKRTDTRDATDMLLALLADPEPGVQAAAIASLGERELGDDDWRRVADVVSRGRIESRLDGPLLNLAARYVGVAPAAAQVVTFVAGRADASPETRGRAQAMLARATAG